MRGRLPGIVAAQRGLFCRHQAIECGYTAREFARVCKPGGPWVRVRYGVYTTREIWAAADALARQRLRDEATLLVCNGDTVLSHASAARAHGLPTYGVTDELSHVTRIGLNPTSRVQAGAKHHRGRLDSSLVTKVKGSKVTGLCRTALDIAAEYGYRSGLVTADAALRAGGSRELLTSLAEALTSEPFAPTIRQVAADADGRAETPIETLGRTLLVSMGVTDLELQWPIELPNHRLAIVDIYSPGLRHVFEADGKVKYTQARRMDGSPMSAEEVLWAEKSREDQIRGLGFGFSRLRWPDVTEEGFERASTRLAQEIDLQSRHDARRRSA